MVTKPKTSTVEMNFNEDLAREVALKLEELRGPVTDEMRELAEKAGAKGSGAWLQKLNSMRPITDEMVKQSILEGSAVFREKSAAGKQAEEDAFGRWVCACIRERHGVLSLGAPTIEDLADVLLIGGPTPMSYQSFLGVLHAPKE